MKIIQILVLLLCINFTAQAQRRTIIVPAPQPPGVPIDGGLLALLLGGGAFAKKYYQTEKTLK